MRLRRHNGGASSYHSLKSSSSITEFSLFVLSAKITLHYYLNLCNTLAKAIDTEKEIENVLKQKQKRNQEQNAGLRLKAFSSILI